MAVGVTATYGNLWAQTATPKTASVTVVANDTLVVLVGGTATGTTFTASGGSLTYTSRVSKNVTQGSGAIFTAPCASGQTFTISMGGTTTTWGFIVLRCTGVSGFGGTAAYADNATGTENTTLTTTGAGSAIAILLQDADTGGAVTWITSSAGAFTAEGTTNSTQSNYPGIYLNAGATGVKTVGVSSPSGSFGSNIVALELQTTAAMVAPSLIVNKALRRSTIY